MPSTGPTVRVGALTIGQSPRPDIVPELTTLVCSRVRPDAPTVTFIEAGALDGLDRDALAALAPAPGESRLVTRLADGTEVKVSPRRLEPLLERAASRLTAAEVRLVALLCTDPLPGFAAETAVIRPAEALRRAVAVRGAVQRLGVLVPSPDQVEEAERSWKKSAGAVKAVGVSPYGGPRSISGDPRAVVSAVADAARALAVWDADLIVLDCLGYTLEMAEAARSAAGRPVLTARTALAEALAAALAPEARP